MSIANRQHLNKIQNRKGFVWRGFALECILSLGYAGVAMCQEWLSGPYILFLFLAIFVFILAVDLSLIIQPENPVKAEVK